jgi:hypothetical protein
VAAIQEVADLVQREPQVARAEAEATKVGPARSPEVSIRAP